MQIRQSYWNNASWRCRTSTWLIALAACIQPAQAQLAAVPSANPNEILVDRQNGEISWDNKSPFAPNEAYGPGETQPAQLNLGSWRTWNSVFAGRSDLGGKPSTGAQPVVVSLFGSAIGADTDFEPIGLIGGSISVDLQTFASGSGGGRSHDLNITLYGRHNITDQAYLIGSVNYGWHNIETSRDVPGFRTRSLTARYQAQDYGTRLESGYSLRIFDPAIISPFLAVAGDCLNQPAYSETERSIFSAAFAGKAMGIGHTELGSRYAQFFDLDSDTILSLDAVAAWEYEIDDSPYVQAAFQSAPDSRFPVYGAMPAKNTAILGSGLRLAIDNLNFGIRGDARLGSNTTIFSGTFDLAVQW